MKKIYLSILLIIGSILVKAQMPDVFVNGTDWLYYYVCPGTSINLTGTTSGGNPPYTCFWSAMGSSDTLSTSFTLNNVGPGTYTLRILKNGVAVGEVDASIFESDSVIVSLESFVYPSGKNISEYGGHDGFITSTVQGGFTPYVYSWSSGQSVPNLDSVIAGTFTLTVTDNEGCHGIKSITLTQPPQPLTITNITSPLQNGYNVSCKGCNDGEINLTVAGGMQPYSFDWDNGKFDEDITDLGAREYKVIVTDQGGAKRNASVTLTEPQKLAVTLSPITYNINGKFFNLSCSDCSNGEITAVVSGGVAGYTYLWSNGQTTATISNLSSMDYTVLVTDANGAKIKESIYLRAPDRNDWSLTGNGGINANTQFIGTTDNKDFVIRTNNNERIRIDSTGKVKVNGVLEANEIISHKSLILDTLKINRIMSHDEDTIIHIGQGSIIINDHKNNIQGDIDLTGTYDGLSIGHGSYSYADNSFACGHFARATAIDGNAFGNYVRANSFNTMVIGNGVYGSGYNGYLTNNIANSVMIGANSNLPSFIVFPGVFDNPGRLSMPTNVELLDTRTDGGNNTMQIVSGNTLPLRRGIHFTDENGNGTTTSSDFNFFIHEWNYSASFNFCKRLGSGTDLSFEKLLTINKNGKVGIGISDGSSWEGDYKLYVIDGIRTEKIRVDVAATVGWADYILQDNYDLMTIDTLKEFINQNGHLPGIPSAAEVQQKGIDVAEMQSRMLAKIEELSLYVIELNNEVNSLKKKLSSTNAK